MATRKKGTRPPGSRKGRHAKKGPPTRKSVVRIPPAPVIPPGEPHLPSGDSPNPPEIAPETTSRSLEGSAVSFPVVGVGASAGGVEASVELLRALPEDTGMAFVFVLHLSPSHPSMLTDILSHATRMPVTEIKEAMQLEPNHVYVIPPSARLTILNGVLHLLPRRREEKGPFLPIDSYFQAMAADLSARAIGVILSGTASDGALGLKAIKAEGGITFAQDERSAKYDGMPRNAQAAGYVDFVLRPKDIAVELARLGRHPYLYDLHRETDHEAPSDLDEDFNRILIVLRAVTGVDLTYYKQTTIRRRILRRMALHRIERQSDYARFLQAHPDEVMRLYEDILINVTGFFRDPAAFDALREVVFPRLFDNRTSHLPVRVWVPGCSSGEEVYSLVMAMLEYMSDTSGRVPIQVFGTDLSEPALEKARAGRYPEAIADAVSPERLHRFFTKTDGGYQIHKSVRDLCIFAKQNVAKDPPFSKIDLLSCRNVLIYFGPVLHKKVLPMFHYALNPSGFLLLGTSETVGSLAHLFSPVDKKLKLYVKKMSPENHFLEDHAAPAYDMKTIKPTEKSTPPKEWKHFDVQKEVDRALLDRYAPASVVVNEDLEILHFRGKTGPFLEPASGAASLNILKMAREGLLFDLRSALLKARDSRKPVRREALVVKENGHTHRVNIEVLPLKDKEIKERFYLVLFERAATPPAAAPAKRGNKGEPSPGPTRGREAARLKQELAAAKEYLQSIIEEQEATNEELQSANEEIQSSNEELQSTNEELETAKEELQSANEELNTVNEALESRNAELNEVNNDLLNLVNSVHVPIIIVGNDLRIRRFTPSSERVLNVIATDIGRKVTDIKLNVVLPDLEEIVADVMDNLRVVEREVQDNHECWYAMRVRPYKTLDNKIDGVVLVFFDIDDMKRIDDQRRLLNELGESLMETVGDPVLLVDRSLKITRANAAFARRFNMARETVEGVSFLDLHERAWRSVEVQEFLDRAVAGDGDPRECVVHVELPGAGPSDWTLMTRGIARAEAGRADLLLLVLRERTQ